MILAVDLGNTNIVFGLFRGKKLLRQWRHPTSNFKLPASRYKIRKIIIASVVPALNKKLMRQIVKQYGVKPYFVTAENIPTLKVLLKNKREIGADRVVDALAAYKLYGGPAIVVDFGTATTFDIISAKGEYQGGVIAPGITLARDALYEQTAKLPKIEISSPTRVIGKDTVSAIRSGLVFGYVALVEGMIARIKSEVRAKNIKVIATGGLAGLICKYTKVVDRIDAKLTLQGLQMIGAILNG
ncbi:MAG: type III pantothenate kinase [Candidatus Margulisbacteria bacterium]|nr:type III pantothenate kinase [Candidatus Margulisiibacteriota bacterium]